MNRKNYGRILLVLSLISINIGCDQVSKKIVRENLTEEENIHYLNNHFTLTRLENSGAFLSVGDSLSKPLRNLLLAVLPLTALALGLFYVLAKTTLSGTSLWSACLIIGGGIGNIFDRLVHGSVTDFLYIHFGSIHTGVFNLADVSIMAGSLALLAHHLIRKPKQV